MASFYSGGLRFKLLGVAEGIEDEETMRLLRSLGSDAGQGYFIARPMPVSDLVRWLLSN